MQAANLLSPKQTGASHMMRLSLKDGGERRKRRILENKTREINRTLMFFLTLLELPVCDLRKPCRQWGG